MKAFHNNPLIKEKYINRLKDHYEADEFIKGTYWEKGKGCAVGCTLHSGEHLAFETELGIPQVLARLEDEIFEGLPNELAKEFPLQFLSAITVGADLLKVWNYFAIWLLTDTEYGVVQHLENKKVVQDVADAYLEDITTSVAIERWEELRDIAYYVASYAFAAASASASAYYAAYYAANTVAATDAADYAAYYAANAAYAATDASDSYSAAAAAKKQAWYVEASKKLIELLTETL